MIESPVLQELKAEWAQEAARKTTRRNIIEFLEARFGVMPQTLEAELNAMDDHRLHDLVKLAATCRTLASFRKKLSS